MRDHGRDLSWNLGGKKKERERQTDRQTDREGAFGRQISNYGKSDFLRKNEIIIIKK